MTEPAPSHPGRLTAFQHLFAAVLLAFGLLTYLTPPAGLPWAAAVILGVAALLGIGAAPVHGLGFFFALWPVSVFFLLRWSVPLFGRPFRLTHVVGGMVFLGLAAALGRLFLKSGFPHGKRRLPLLALSAFGMWLIGSTLLSPTHGSAVSELIRFLVTFGIFLLAMVVGAVPQHRRFLLESALIGACWSAAGAVVIRLFQLPMLVWHRAGVFRSVGTFGDANRSGLLAVWGLALLALLLVEKAPLGRIARWVFPLILSAGCAVTLSRTAFLFLILSLLAWGLFTTRPTWRPRLLSGAGILALAVFLLLSAGNRFRDTGSSPPPVDRSATPAQELADQPGSGRLTIWRSYTSAWVAGGPRSWILGRGLGSTQIVAEEAGLPLLPDGQVRFGPHNEYIWLLVETGALGFGLHLAFILALFGWLWSRRSGCVGDREPWALLAGLLLAHQLSGAVFDWQITALGTRLYLVLLFGLALSAPPSSSR